MPLLKWDREDFGMMLPHVDGRRPLDSHENQTVAMHWDGTYRDRVNPNYWPWREFLPNGADPAPISTFAKHLA